MAITYFSTGDSLINVKRIEFVTEPKFVRGTRLDKSYSFFKIGTYSGYISIIKNTDCDLVSVKFRELKELLGVPIPHK